MVVNHSSKDQSLINEIKKDPKKEESENEIFSEMAFTNSTTETAVNNFTNVQSSNLLLNIIEFFNSMYAQNRHDTVNATSMIDFWRAEQEHIGNIITTQNHDFNKVESAVQNNLNIQNLDQTNLKRKKSFKFSIESLISQDFNQDNRNNNTVFNQ